MKRETKTKKVLRSYKKPTIEKIKLISEEVVLRGCTGPGEGFQGKVQNGCPILNTCQSPSVST